jgi:hypothetical protein
VLGVEREDLRARAPHNRPPALGLDLWHQQLLTMLIDRVLDHPHDAAQRVLVAGIGAGEEDGKDRLAFAGTRLLPRGLRLGIGEPLRGACLARIPFDEWRAP